MVSAWWLIAAFYAGLACGIALIALLRANGGPTREDDQEQVEYIRDWQHTRTPDAYDYGDSGGGW